MCNCLSETLKEIKEKYSKWPDENGKKVERMYYSDAGLNFRTGKTCYGMGIDIKFEGQKKTGHTYLNMGYCPVCGKKLED
ncbi:MAG TPA: hypothetical protein VGB37_13870 [Candidatus Lokiarchaeia archaeon]